MPCLLSARPNKCSITVLAPSSQERASGARLLGEWFKKWCLLVDMHTGACAHTNRSWWWMAETGLLSRNGGVFTPLTTPSRDWREARYSQSYNVLLGLVMSWQEVKCCLNNGWQCKAVHTPARWVMLSFLLVFSQSQLGLTEYSITRIKRQICGYAWLDSWAPFNMCHILSKISCQALWIEKFRFTGPKVKVFRRL